MSSKKFSYITVLSTENYLEGVLALAKSLQKTGTKYPISVLITDKISNKAEKLLEESGINVIKRDKIQIPEEIKNENKAGMFPHWIHTFDKLHIFELTEFDKLVYLDSDMYVRKNIDELFEMENMSATIDRPYGPIINDSIDKKLTSGIMVIEPRNGILKELIKVMQEISQTKKSLGDQDVLQGYDSNWGNKENLHLDFKYNMFFPHLDYFTKYNGYNLDDIKVIHFICTKKPFFFRRDEVEDYISIIEENKNNTYNSYKEIFPHDYIKCGNEDEIKVLEEYFNVLDEVR